MTQTLTITVDNIPEDVLSQVWKDSIRDAKKSMGFVFEKTDDIKLDFALLVERYPEHVPLMLSELLVSAIGTYSIQYFENKYNNGNKV